MSEAAEIFCYFVPGPCPVCGTRVDMDRGAYFDEGDYLGAYICTGCASVLVLSETHPPALCEPSRLTAEMAQEAPDLYAERRESHDRLWG